MSFCPSTDTINYIFRNALLNCTDNGDLYISGGSLLPYVIYTVQQQQANIALLKSENQIQASEITALQATVAAQSTQVLQAQVNAQQIQIEQLLARLSAAGIA
jgi:hypothetical protein